MRNPNGFGGVTKLPGKRRKPYRARVFIGKKDGKQQYTNVGYFATRSEALNALSNYNQNPNIYDSATITFEEVYNRWAEHKYPALADRGSSYIAAYSLCGDILNEPMQSIKAAQLQSIMDNCGKNYPTRRTLKLLWGQVWKFAVQNDIVDKDCAKYVEVGKDTDLSYKLNRSPFTQQEIDKLWQYVDRLQWIDTILILIYTGMRIGELFAMRSADVYLDERYMRGGEKTDAGKNRVIPIHERIVPLVQKWLDNNTNLLITNHGRAMVYQTFLRIYWDNIMEQMEMYHRPHDTRHTFASLADTAGMNKLCIKRIMGHASKDVTDKVYTHKDIAELVSEVNKLI